MDEKLVRNEKLPRIRDEREGDGGICVCVDIWVDISHLLIPDPSRGSRRRRKIRQGATYLKTLLHAGAPAGA